MPRAIIRALNIILAAILAGVSFGIWAGFNPHGLSPSTYIEQQQNMLHGLRILMVAIVIATTIITIVSAFVQRHDKPVFFGLLVAAACFVACILITVLGNKPIDNMVLSWNAGSLPQNWIALRDRWWQLHVFRTSVELAGLFIVTWVSVKKD